jgi:hypothetical protein
MKRAAWLLILGACATSPTSTPSSAPPRAWAVVPMEEGGDLAELLADELVRTRASRVVRPSDFGSSVDVGAVVAAARAHRVERILAVKVRRHDPYDPPRTSLAVEVLRADRRTLSGGELDRLVSSASWQSAPLPPGREHAGHAVAVFELVVDARDPATRSWLSSYAETRRSPDGAWSGLSEFLAVESRWMEFVAHVVVHRVPNE